MTLFHVFMINLLPLHGWFSLTIKVLNLLHSTSLLLLLRAVRPVLTLDFKLILERPAMMGTGTQETAAAFQIVELKQGGIAIIWTLQFAIQYVEMGYLQGLKDAMMAI